MGMVGQFSLLWRSPMHTHFKPRLHKKYVALNSDSLWFNAVSPLGESGDNKSSWSVSISRYCGCVNPWLEAKIISLSFYCSSPFSLSRLLFLLPSCVYEIASFKCLVCSILSTCPKAFHLLRLLGVLIDSNPALLLTPSCVTFFGQ